MRFAVVATLAFALAPGVFAQRSQNFSPSHASGLRPGVPPVGPPPPANLRGGRRPYGGGAWIIPYPAYVDPFYAGYSEPGYEEQAPPPTIFINPNFQPEIVRPQIRDYSNVPLPEPGVTIAPPGAAAPPTPAAATPPRAADDDESNIFLIALKDQSVLAVVAYWVQEDTLNYIALNGAHRYVSLSLVDRDLSKRLNAGRQVQFRLPAPR